MTKLFPIALGVFTFSVKNLVICTVHGESVGTVFVTVHQKDGALPPGAPGPGPLWRPSRNATPLEPVCVPLTPGEA